MLRLGLLFVTVTSLELVVLMQVGGLLGVGWTVALIFFTGFLGAYLTRLQGLKILRDISETLQRGAMPTHEILNGVCLLVVGALLVTPGLLTDITGFLLLVPAIRHQVIALAQRRMERWIANNAVPMYVGDMGDMGDMGFHHHESQAHYEFHADSESHAHNESHRAPDPNTIVIEHDPDPNAIVIKG